MMLGCSTRTEKLDALTVKTFMFEFVNNYFNLLYLAYIQQFVSTDVDIQSVMFSLTDLLVTYKSLIVTHSGCQEDPVFTAADNDASGSTDGLENSAGSALSDLQLQLAIVFTGKTIGLRAAGVIIPKVQSHALCLT